MRGTGTVWLLACVLLFGACVQPVGGEVVDSSPPTAAANPTEPPVPVATPAPTIAQITPTSASTPVPQSENEGESPSVTDANPPIDNELLAIGKDVYRQQACGVCHTLAAIGSQGTFGPPQDDLASIAAARIHEERYKGSATTAEEYIRESIVNPQAFMVTGYQITRFPMPIFTNLSEREVEALVYLLMQPPAIAP